MQKNYEEAKKEKEMRGKFEVAINMERQARRELERKVEYLLIALA